MSAKSQSAVHISIKDDDDVEEITSSYYETERNWRNIIFLPYRTSWKILVVITIILNLSLALYYLVFADIYWSYTYSIPYYACEIIYFLDVMLVLMHRSMPMYRKTQLYAPRHALLVTIDIISLLPYYELYYIIEHCSYGGDAVLMKNYMKLKILLRLQYAIAFHRSIRNHPGVNQIVVVIFGQFYLFTLYVLFASCIWYLVKDYGDKTWVRYLHDYKYDENNSMHWFIICVSIIGNCFMHSSAGPIGVKNTIEYIIYISTLIIGCLIHVMIFFGDLTAQHIQKYKHQLEFSARMNIIISMMSEWKTDEVIQKKTIEHYRKYWEMRQGMSNVPAQFRTLPLSVQKEVTVDLFWDCIIHTHLFNDTEMNFKRSLTLEMKTEFYLPGDYLFVANRLKNKMAYLASGIVQILSQEDQQSPVMSFSSGTLFGEIATMFLVPSLINLRCATYCEIYTLSLVSLSRIMVHYKTAAKTLRHRVANRIESGKVMQHPLLLQMKDKQQKRTSIRWLKNQWRCIYSHSRKKNPDAHDIPISPCHMSNHLNMYALSGDVELKERVICLKSTCPYVMEPTSSFKKFCGYMLLAVVVLQCVLVPYLVFFSKTMSTRNTGFFYMMDLMYICGLYLELTTAIKKKEVLITDPKDILFYKIRKTLMIIDVMATLPLELVAYLLNCSHYVQMLMHLNRILKIHKIYTTIKAAETKLLSNALRLRLFKFSMVFAYCVYFFGCILYGVACPDGACLKYGWFRYNQELESKSNKSIPKNLVCSDFIISINYAVSMILGLTDSSIYSYTIRDMFVELLLTFIGYCLFSFCFSELAACSVLQLAHTNDFLEYLKTLKVFNTNNDISQELKKSLYEITLCEWNYNKKFKISGEDGMLNDAPENLKNIILHERIVNCLLTVPFFQLCDKSVLWNLAPLARLNIIPPGTVISRSEAYPTYLKVILRGYCKIETSIPTDNYHGCSSIYTAGSVFPLMELFLDIDTFIKATCITFVEVASIPGKSVINQLKNNDADFYSDLTISMGKYVKDYDTVLMRRKGRLPEMVASKRSYGKGEHFTYETNEDFDDTTDKQAIDLAKWKYIRHCFLKRTLSPTKPLYIIWESFRCLTALINIIYTLSMMKYCMSQNYDRYIQIYFIVVTLMDFYIRMHCQYYNEKGILVTHPWYTAKYYVSGAFILDLYCNFPFTVFKVDMMFHGQFRIWMPVILMLMTRCLLTYRLYFGLSYIQSQSKEGKAVLVERIKYGLMIFVMFGMCGCILEHFTCSYRGVGLSYDCFAHSWIERSIFVKNISHMNMILISNYQILTLFTTSSVGIFLMKTFWETLIHLLLVFVLFALKWFVLAKIVSSAIKGNTRLLKYQHNVHVMSAFLRKYLVRRSLIKEAVDHYEYLLKRTYGYDINETITSFATVLRADFKYSMYSPVLVNAELFGGCTDSDIRYICIHLKGFHFKKDAQIIRCNDVQDRLFIVYKGKVRISIAQTRLKVLNPGGSFGCYQIGKTRQTITATATLHVELLYVESNVLNMVSQRIPALKQKLKKAHFLKVEYMGSKYVDTSKEKVAVENNDYIKKWKRFLIDPNNRWYAICNYLLNVHVATISSMLVIVVVTRKAIYRTYYYYLYIFDVLFLSKMIIGFHLTYVDHETGLLVSDLRSIAKKYLTRWTGFWLDLVTCLPFELIAMLITKNEIVHSCCWINRSLRFIHFMVYYNNCKNKLTVSKTLKWTYLMYMMVIVIHFLSIIWWLISCPNDICVYVSGLRHENTTFRKSNNPWLNFQITYQYVVSIFSSTGVRDQVPVTITELTVSIFILVISQGMAYTLTAGFATILCLGKYVLYNYEMETGHLNTFLKNTNVSPPIINKIRTYFIVLWLQYSGVSMPTLIAEAPAYLKQDIMFALYGYHLMNHVLFAKTHKDFIRQLLAHLVPQVYLPGQYIIEKGDIDGRIYFIHTGEVKVFDKHGNNEIEQCVLRKGASFGEYQGLKNMEHARSVKTTVVCTILSLKTADWNYLLDWFPASKEIMMASLANFSHSKI